MSTDRQRLQAAIQRIAKSDPDLSALISASKNKGGQASSSGIGTSDAERDNLCCDGTTGAGANAGSDQRDPSGDGSSALDSTDPANLDSMGQGSLTDITDCATGDPICFDGSDWLPPDGWDGPTDPPLDDTWEDGVYYRGFVAGSPRKWLTYGAAGSEVCAALCDCEDEGALSCSVCLASTTGFTGNCEQESYNWGPRQCDEEPDPLCDEPQPTEEFWPPDLCNNLVIKNGKIVGSKFDPENDGSYSKPRDELEVCDSSGNRILLRGSPTGGWKSIKSLSGDIDPDTGNGYLYRPNGQRVRQISPSEFRDDTV